MKFSKITYFSYIIFPCITLTFSACTGPSQEDVIEKFLYAVQKPNDELQEESQTQLEVLIIGRKVPWMEAKLFCPSYSNAEVQQKSSQNTNSVVELENAIENSNSDDVKWSTSLAILSDEEERNWLARMLSESNYRYEGLWVGGKRKDKSSKWNWVGDNNISGKVLDDSLVYDSYPSWYKVSESKTEQNCLLFDRLGHDVPILLPENCYAKRPFICMRKVKIKKMHEVYEGNSISVDGYRYTLYQIINKKDKSDANNIQKLNGGGITWSEANKECSKRGQQLATVLSNEAAIAVAAMMMKIRPSMESIWLGAKSSNGIRWKWIPSGAHLSAIKSTSTSYPPWLEGHPIAMPSNENYHKSYERCLILDRHLCPEQVSPVFLDLDCEKERPFVCQTEVEKLIEHKRGVGMPSLTRRSLVNNNEVYEFSEEKMTYEDGKEYCNNINGQIANIYDSKTLSACLEKMYELSIDHVWVEGKTVEKNGRWHWVDENDEMSSNKNAIIGTSWCFGKEKSLSQKAEPNSCLNLDNEARGFPLFYGIPCDSLQLVVCSMQSNSSIEETPVAGIDDVDTRSFDTSPKAKHANETEKKALTTTTVTQSDNLTPTTTDLSTTNTPTTTYNPTDMISTDVERTTNAA